MTLGHAQLQAQRMDQLEVMAPADLDAVLQLMATPQPLPRPDYHFQHHRQEFRRLGIHTQQAYLELFTSHIQRNDVWLFTFLKEVYSMAISEADSSLVQRVKEALGTRVNSLTSDRVPWPMSGLVKSYGIYVADLRDSDDIDSTDVLLTLLARDEIARRWEEVTPAQRRKVDQLDILLASLHATVAPTLPNALSTDRHRWWWFLDEGPQVREAAVGDTTSAKEFKVGS